MSEREADRPGRPDQEPPPAEPKPDTGRAMARAWSTEKVRLFGAIAGGVLVVDVLTKLLIQRTFRLYQQIEVLGDYFRLTYIYNPGAAFGLYLGEYSRWIFLILSLVALGALLSMYWITPIRDRVRLTAIALVCGGAVGNLIDRVRSERGVVDFLDVGIGDLRWPVFNVADIAVTTGAILLAISLWNEEHPADAGEGDDDG